ncbi:MAG: hypothetical protein ACTSRK_07530 [Promethearchaeota archaeon]
MDDNQIFAEQEAIIRHVKQALKQIDQTPDPEEKEGILYDLIAFLISSSNDIAQNNDFYEAAGRLYSSAFYLEQVHVERAQEIYLKVIDYYQEYFNILVSREAHNDATNVLIKIASIYLTKLKDKSKYEEYIKQGISIIAQIIPTLEQQGELRELCGKHQMLAMLYEKVDQWEDVLKHAKLALHIAKRIKDFSVITNSYFDIHRSLLVLQNSSKADNVLYEAIDYFAKEAEFYEIHDDFIPLAQIYQIIKNMYDKLKKRPKYESYARKEAGVYLALANNGVKRKLNYAQIGSYYRGAALCYGEIKGNTIDAASCYFLAANYYNQAKKFYDAALNFEDAAKLFEDLLKYQKAHELYLQSSSCALRINDYEYGILNLINAEALGVKMGLDLSSLYLKLQQNLTKYAEIQHKNKNFFISGTLYLEAAEYTSKQQEKPYNEVSFLLSKSLAEYWALFTETDFNQCPNSSVFYVCVLIILLSSILSDSSQNSETDYSIVNSYLTENAPPKYLQFAGDVHAVLVSRQPLRKSFFIKTAFNFQEHGIAEIQKIHELFFQYSEFFENC